MEALFQLHAKAYSRASTRYLIQVNVVSVYAFIIVHMDDFSMIGIQSKQDLGLNETEFGLLVATPVLTGSLSRIVLPFQGDNVSRKGASHGPRYMSSGIALAIAIGLQNIPEGMAVAFPLVALGYSRAKAVWIGTLTGLVEPAGGLFGVTTVSLFGPILPVAMGFAAGAMLFVISEEIIPETQSRGKTRHATYAVLLGFIIMMALDNLLR